MRHFTLGALLAAVLAVPAMAADYTIIAPANPGGGWDQTARTMQDVLQKEGISKSVQVQNVPGAGGTIGLAQFAEQHKGDPNALIIGGFVMVGAVLTNNSPVSLADVTPIARLTGEYEAIVVPAASPHQTMADLIAALKADPGAVSWAGGSAGGTDHIAVGLIAQAAGVYPTRINYIAYSGGGEALEQAQHDQQNRRGDADLAVGRQAPHQERRDAHQQQRADQDLLAAQLVADVTHQEGPERPGDVRDAERGQ